MARKNKSKGKSHEIEFSAVPTLTISVEDIPSAEEFFATGLTLAKDSDITPATLCTVCSLGVNEGAPSMPWVRITKCGHIVHKKCMLSWAMNTSEKRDECPTCGVQLFKGTQFNFILFALAKHEGAMVTEEFVPDAPIYEFGDTCFTEEDVFRLEVRVIHAVTTNYIRAAKYSGLYTEDDIDVLLLYEEIQDRIHTLGMPWAKYTSSKEGVSYFEWKAAVAGHVLDQFRLIMPEVVVTMNYQIIEQERQNLLAKAKIERLELH